MSYRRKAIRLVIERKGDIHRRGKTFPCTVVDVSEEGVRVKTAAPVTVGEELQVDCYLTKDWTVQCTVQVVHASPSQFGSRITGISPEQLSRLREFVDDLIAQNFPRA